MKVTREVDIFQCPVSTKYCFRPLRTVKDGIAGININDYVRVWNGIVKLNISEQAPETNVQQAICEYCFDRFQDGRDKTFFGRSLSVSDIVDVKISGVHHYYYCDTIGFKLIDIQNV